MRLYALLALCVLQAHAATISVPQRKLDDLDNVDLDNVVSEPELVDQANTVKDIENNLRNALGIPVKVIEDKVKKIDENSNDYVPGNDFIDVKRAPIDLRNPGPPQRQEHETQNPEHYSDAQKAIFAIKQTIEDTQNVFTLGLKGISENFNNLFANNEQLSTIQQNIQNLKSSFNEQVLKLNNTIKSYINPDKVEEADEDVKAVETRLRALESNFKSGVHTLSEGVELLAIIKEEDEAAKAEGDAAATSTGNQNGQTSSTTQTPVSQNNNPVMQFLYNFQQGMINSISGLNSAVSNYFSQGQNQAQTQQTSTPPGGNFVGSLLQGIQLPFVGQQGQQQASQTTQGEQKPPGAAADEPAQTGWRPPNIIQQVQSQWNNLINGGQSTQQQQQQQQQQSGQNPLAQAFQNIVNVFQRPGQNQQGTTPPSTNQQPGNNPGTTVATAAADVSQGFNVVPADPAPQLQDSAPQPAQTVQPAATPTHSGPIQQLVQNNPIIKGLQTVAKRITNPETPRDTLDKNEDSKGHGVWGGNNTGDNSNSNRVKDEPAKIEKIEETPIKCEKKEEIVTEKISLEPAKTE